MIFVVETLNWLSRCCIRCRFMFYILSILNSVTFHYSLVSRVIFGGLFSYAVYMFYTPASIWGVLCSTIFQSLSTFYFSHYPLCKFNYGSFVIIRLHASTSICIICTHQQKQYFLLFIQYLHYRCIFLGLRIHT